MAQAARSVGPGACHDDFRLSITKALGDRLARAVRLLGYPEFPNEHKSAWRYGRSGRVTETPPGGPPRGISSSPTGEQDT